MDYSINIEQVDVLMGVSIFLNSMINFVFSIFILKVTRDQNCFFFKMALIVIVMIVVMRILLFM